MEPSKFCWPIPVAPISVGSNVRYLENNDLRVEQTMNQWNPNDYQQHSSQQQKWAKEILPRLDANNVDALLATSSNGVAAAVS